MKVLIAGDFAPMARLSEVFKGTYGSNVLKGVIKYINDSDFSIVNLEAPVKVSDDFKIQKSGPHLYASDNAIKAIKDAGFNACCIANNHLRDYGNEGVSATLDSLKKNGLTFVGGGMNLDEANKTLVVNINGQILSIIAVCEKENSIASDTCAGSAPMDIIDTSKRIIEAKKNSDHVLVLTHGGHEYFHYPSPRMKKLYRYFVDLGADAVINHHQHCISGYEIYNKRPIIYGLGNFCFDRPDKRNGSWNDGYMALINFDDPTNLTIIPYIQCNDNANVTIATNMERQRIMAQVAQINQVIADDKLLASKHHTFIMQKKKKNIMAVFSPYLWDKLRIAAGHHFIPYLLPKNKVRAMLNMIQCESHFDETIEVLTNYLNKK